MTVKLTLTDPHLEHGQTEYWQAQPLHAMLIHASSSPEIRQWDPLRTESRSSHFPPATKQTSGMQGFLRATT